jgi:hypothetical protein
MVAYVFLTYPFVSNDKTTTDRRSGVPRYAEMYSRIISLCNEPVEDAELLRAWVIFGYFRIVNPLVVSSRVRALVADPASGISKLLLARMRGSDRCSQAVLDELAFRGVAM